MHQEYVVNMKQIEFSEFETSRTAHGGMGDASNIQNPKKTCKKKR